jgi:prolyl-tRNA synthetase
LNHYAHIYEHLLAAPVIKAEKTPSQTLAGAQYTNTVAAFIPGLNCFIQGAAFHGLGQELSKTVGIAVKNPNFSATINTEEESNKSLVHPWQTSWNISAQSIGIMTLTHSDNRGLVLPPRVADIQAINIPVRFSKSTREERPKDYSAIGYILTTLRTAKLG